MEQDNLSFKRQSPEVIVVEASAGSGKTYALAKRYVQLLINPQSKSGYIPLRSILAITFTNKAAIEMKERILEFLKRIAFDCFPSPEQKKDIYDVLGVNEKFAKERARQVMNYIIAHYSFFQVQTIDSFINSFLLGCAFEVGRSAHFKIKRDYEDYFYYCLDLLIDKSSTNKEIFNLLERFLKHYLFVENQRGWFPKEDILSLIISLFNLTNKYGRMFYEGEGNSSQILKLKGVLFNKIEKLAKEFPGGMNKRTKNSIIKFLDQQDNRFDISKLPKKFKEKEVPMNKGKSTSVEFKKKWEDIHENIKKLVKLESEAVYNPYIGLFHKFLEMLGQVSKKEDVLFLDELNYKASGLFGDSGVTVAELYYRLASRFHHYLIDEFQDTSVLQWSNFFLMVEEALSSGGSLFYVGDKKQAIYRFRGGEPKLFDKVKENFKAFNVTPYNLTVNWRSEKQVVDFNNRIFSQDNIDRMLESSGIKENLAYNEDYINKIRDVFQDSFQKNRRGKKSGFVQVEKIKEKNQQERDEIMQEKLIDLIRGLRQRFRFEDISVLARDNSEVELLTSWLLEKDIPAESEKTLNLLENKIIREIISFLKFLYSPIDNLSFACFIQGDLFLKAANLKIEKIRNFLFVLNEKTERYSNLNLYIAFRNNFPELWDVYISEFFKNVGFTSVYELLISIYKKFNVGVNFKDYQAFFMKLIELVKKKEDERIGLADFLEYLKNAPQDDLYVNVARTKAVKVLTIHKSKGLEFPAVIIPFLRMDIKPATGSHRAKSYINYFDQDRLQLIRITEDFRNYSRKLREIYRFAYRDACIDELNNMYVAFTRAENELYVFVPNKSGSSKNKASFIFPEERIEYGEKSTYARQEKESQKQSSVIPIPFAEYKDWISSIEEEFSSAQSFCNRDKVLQGEILHEMLSYIENCRNLNLEEAINRSVENTKAKFQFVSDFSPYEKKIRQLIKDPQTKNIFYPENGRVFCEKELVNQFGDNKRIDRLIVKPFEVLIVDFKSTGLNKEEDKKQINDYEDIVKQIYSQSSIGKYLVYLDEVSVEKV